MVLSRQEIIKRGFVDVHVRIAGIRQCHRLILSKNDRQNEKVFYFITKVDMPTGEMLRLAEELDFPIKSPKSIVFPKGKAPDDFIVTEQSHF